MKEATVANFTQCGKFYSVANVTEILHTVANFTYCGKFYVMWQILHTVANFRVSQILQCGKCHSKFHK